MELNGNDQFWYFMSYYFTDLLISYFSKTIEWIMTPTENFCTTYNIIVFGTEFPVPNFAA